MSAPYQSYPPSILMLPHSHDLKLVGTPQAGSHLIVDFSWDSNGRSATISFGDGTSETNSDEVAQHTYADFGTYTATVRSGQASDSADLMLEADEPAPEPEDEPVAPEEAPDPEEAPESPTDPVEEA